MFVLDMESVLPPANENGGLSDFLVVWRYIPYYRYGSCGGVPKAKPAAFKIKRNPDGSAKEPSASLFELNGKAVCSEANAVCMMGLLISEKNFKSVEPGDGSGSLKISDVNELLKDPRAFSLARTSKQRSRALLHWDLTYAKDDREPDMEIAKSQLAHICKIYVTGAAALAAIGPALLPGPPAN